MKTTTTIRAGLGGLIIPSGNERGATIDPNG